MLKSAMRRSFAKSTVAGTVLAVAGLAGPAVVISAPSLSLVACRDNYPSATRTTTNLTLSSSMVEYGTRPTASVTVTATAGRPTGSVRFAVGGESWDVRLAGGRASQQLPGDLDARKTYVVRARFVPDCETGQFAPSNDTASLSVFKAATRVGAISAPDIKRGQKFAVEAVVSSRRSPDGEAKVVLSKGNRKVKDKVDVVRLGGGDSMIRADFGKKIDRVGTWAVEVVYLGSDNFKSSSKSTTFQVRR